jgi:hypothetical protein
MADLEKIREFHMRFKMAIEGRWYAIGILTWGDKNSQPSLLGFTNYTPDQLQKLLPAPKKNK